ncbi:MULTISPECIES: hypothetical protein [Streptomycetaceae]|uniref:hypothetical protein n=1 Tax=unclassified Streptomyces TaxID=2593676 RepID=UPI00336D94DB
MSSIWHDRLAEADISVREERRPFDVAAGLRRLAREAGYIGPAPAEPRSLRARHRLGLIAHWTVTQAGAATHVEELTAVIGDNGTGEPEFFNGWTDVDTHGAHVFACTLYLANHPESAVFWWMFAAGAGHSGSAYLLHLHHITAGEMREAAFWKKQVVSLREHVPDDFDGSTEEFIEELLSGLEIYTGYSVRHRDSWPTPSGETQKVVERHLEERFERLADREENDGIVARPDSQLPDRIHELAELR